MSTSANCARAKTLEILELLEPSWGLLTVLTGTCQEPARALSGPKRNFRVTLTLGVPVRGLIGRSVLSGPRQGPTGLTGGHTLLLREVRA